MELGRDSTIIPALSICSSVGIIFLVNGFERSGSSSPGADTAAHQSVVGARYELRFDLLRRVQSHADYDEERGAAEVERHTKFRLQELTVQSCAIAGPERNGCSNKGTSVGFRWFPPC